MPASGIRPRGDGQDCPSSTEPSRCGRRLRRQTSAGSHALRPSTAGRVEDGQSCPSNRESTQMPASGIRPRGDGQDCPSSTEPSRCGRRLRRQTTAGPNAVRPSTAGRVEDGQSCPSNREPTQMPASGIRPRGDRQDCPSSTEPSQCGRRARRQTSAGSHAVRQSTAGCVDAAPRPWTS